MLDDTTCSVTTVESGKDALSTIHSLAQNNTLPTLIILDMVMPVMSGIEVLEALRRDSATQSIPVLMLTGERDPQAAFQESPATPDAIMGKPFTRQLLRDQVQRMISLRTSTQSTK